MHCAANSTDTGYAVSRFGVLLLQLHLSNGIGVACGYVQVLALLGCHTTGCTILDIVENATYGLRACYDPLPLLHLLLVHLRLYLALLSVIRLS